VLCAGAAVPALSSSPRAASWLRAVLWLNVLFPVYLFSGISKLRYWCVPSNLSGDWMLHALRPGVRSVYPPLNAWLVKQPAACALFSWGNLWIEFVGPLLVVALPAGHESANAQLATFASIVRLVYLASCAAFHVSIFLLLGPNFLRLALLLALAHDPLARRRDHCYLDVSQEPPEPTTPITRADHARAALATSLIIFWFAVQVQSDLDHLSGKTPRTERHNPYWPLPELSMFTKPGAGSDFVLGLALTGISGCALAYRVLRTVKAGPVAAPQRG